MVVNLEVGKFITQKNDYFFPPAAPLIYSLFLLIVLLFLLVRRSRKPNPRSSMYQALLGMKEVLDNNIDPRERERLLANLANGRNAAEPHIKQLADQLTTYLQQDTLPLIPYKPGVWTRLNQRLEALGAKVRRKNHRRLIIIVTALLSLAAIFTVAFLLVLLFLPQLSGMEIWQVLLAEAETLSTQNPVWLAVRMLLQTAVGLLYGLALLRIWQGKENVALNIAIFATLLSVTAVNLLTFYIDQFTALASILATFALLFLLLTYRSWYIDGDNNAK